jgi:hypothetical protein
MSSCETSPTGVVCVSVAWHGTQQPVRGHGARATFDGQIRWKGHLMTNISSNPIYTGEPEDLKFAYWVPNVSGGWSCRTSRSAPTGDMTTTSSSPRPPNRSATNTRSARSATSPATVPPNSTNRPRPHSPWAWPQRSSRSSPPPTPASGNRPCSRSSFSSPTSSPGPRGHQRRLRLVQGRIHPPRPAVARTR